MKNWIVIRKGDYGRGEINEEGLGLLLRMPQHSENAEKIPPSAPEAHSRRGRRTGVRKAPEARDLDGLA